MKKSYLSPFYWYLTIYIYRIVLIFVWFKFVSGYCEIDGMTFTSLACPTQ